MCELVKTTESQKEYRCRAFNRVFGWIEHAYTSTVRLLLRFTPLVLVAFIATLGFTGWWYSKLPTGFLPTEDQGYMITSITLPDAASQERTRDVVEQVNAILSRAPGVETWFSIGGLSLLEGSQASNAATVFVRLKPWDERTTPDVQQDAILGYLTQAFGKIQDAVVFTFPPPAIQGLGISGGFEMQIEDRGGRGLNELQAAVQQLLAAAGEQPEVTRLNTTFRAGVPQLEAVIDRAKVKSLEVPLNQVFGTLQASLGSIYVNDFNKFGRTYQVRLQADGPYRNDVDDVRRLNVRNRNNDMVSLGTLVQIRESFGPQTIKRFNLYPNATLTGSPSPGQSSGQVLDLMEQLAHRELPEGISFDWTGVSLQERQVSGEAIWVFGLAVLMVYLVLAFLYESWILPLAVILVVPLGLLGTVAFIWFRGMDNNTYVQIGVVLIIALASKNAILIVEFARDLRHAGRGIVDAAIEASRMRFRPILMTSFAFILGVLPLVTATGAAAASRRSLGTAVCGGMITSTVLAIFFTPVFYVTFQWLSEKLSRRSPGVATFARTWNELFATPPRPSQVQGRATQIYVSFELLWLISSRWHLTTPIASSGTCHASKRRYSPWASTTALANSSYACQTFFAYESGKTWKLPSASPVTIASETTLAGSAISSSPAAFPISVIIGPGWTLIT